MYCSGLKINKANFSSFENLELFTGDPMMLGDDSVVPALITLNVVGELLYQHGSLISQTSTSMSQP